MEFMWSSVGGICHHGHNHSGTLVCMVRSSLLKPMLYCIMCIMCIGLYKNGRWDCTPKLLFLGGPYKCDTHPGTVSSMLCGGNRR